MNNHNYPHLNPTDWCLIQYLMGLDINGPYNSMEDTFKVILKQYILYFEANYISSRDKKALWSQFQKDYNRIQESMVTIKEKLAQHMATEPHDDLILRSLHVGIFRLQDKDYNWDPLILFVEENNKPMVNFFTSILKKFS